uniref:Ribonuclease Oy n=1 Tax=Phallusia mammillata TaxID=59560 RepID=A0A6F9DRJ2_9ASCI|nr:ribonuclease Oy [Phallusia mammillata]
MKSYTQTLLQIMFLMAFICMFGILQHKTSQWDFLIFTQQWPQASCVDINNTRGETCFMERKVKTWTIHGIWPSRIGDEGPFYCNNSYPFKETEVASLEPELTTYWPNLILDESKCSFWKHEWVKHGTCAMSLPTMDTEYKYFAQGLKFNRLFDFKAILAKQNIVPFTSPYKFSDFRKAIQSTTNTHMKIQCIYSKDRQEQAVIQVEICLKKDFTPIDCVQTRRVRHLKFRPSWDSIPYNPSFEDCSESIPVQYLPLQYNV